jgi:hypothetical protein
MRSCIADAAVAVAAAAASACSAARNPAGGFGFRFGGGGAIFGCARRAGGPVGVPPILLAGLFFFFLDELLG